MFYCKWYLLSNKGSISTAISVLFSVEDLSLLWCKCLELRRFYINYFFRIWIFIILNRIRSFPLSTSLVFNKEEREKNQKHGENAVSAKCFIANLWKYFRVFIKDRIQSFHKVFIVPDIVLTKYFMTSGG